MRLAELAKRAGVRRFLYASTCSVYGAAGDDFLDEDSPLQPGHALRRVQGALGAAICGASPTAASARSICAPRPPTASRRCCASISSVNNLVAWAATTGQVFLKSLGTSWRPLVHIEDIAQAYVALLQAPEEMVHNQAFNVGQTEENYRISDVAELVRQIVPDTAIEFAADASADQRNYRVNCDRSGARCRDYRPHWTVAAGHPRGLRGDPRRRAQQRGFRGPALQPDRLILQAAGARAGSTPTCAGRELLGAAAA